MAEETVERKQHSWASTMFLDSIGYNVFTFYSFHYLLTLLENVTIGKPDRVLDGTGDGKAVGKSDGWFDGIPLGGQDGC